MELQGEWRQREDQSRGSACRAAEAEAAGKRPNEHDTDESGDDHRLACGEHSEVVAGEGSGQLRVSGDLDPAERRMVVAVGIVRELAKRRHGIGLGGVSTLVIDSLGRAPEVDERHYRRDDEYRRQPGKSETVANEEPGEYSADPVCAFREEFAKWSA